MAKIKLVTRKLVEGGLDIQEKRIAEFCYIALNTRLCEVAKKEQVLSIRQSAEGEGARRGVMSSA